VLYSLNQDEDWSWDGFYESFPKYVGLTRVSRVGFNEDRTQALLYIGRQTHWLSGLGVVYFLVRAAGQWNIETRITVWIS